MPARYLMVCIDFKPTSVMFAPHQYDQIVLSDIGVVLWLAAIITWSYYRGFAEVVRLYLVPYLWCVSSPIPNIMC
jgi:omega-6 fatty acid desaturase / acyl-lipid omega-6 desaturase (Delta-12 desaturase)